MCFASGLNVSDRDFGELPTFLGVFLFYSRATCDNFLEETVLNITKVPLYKRQSLFESWDTTFLPD